MTNWAFLTNHTLVLSHIALHPRITARQLADAIGITERATRKIIADLLEADYITKKREGRGNHYRVNPDRPLSPPGLDKTAVGYLLEIIGWKRRGRPRKSA